MTPTQRIQDLEAALKEALQLWALADYNHSADVGETHGMSPDGWEPGGDEFGRLTSVLTNTPEPEYIRLNP